MRRRKKREKPKSIENQLSDLTSEYPTPKHHRAWAKEANAIKSDLYGAWVEMCLRLALETALTNENISRRLFKPNALLGNLGAKIDLARALNIIGDETNHNLHILRRIRNTFAHASRPVSFRTSIVRKVCRKLRVPRDIRPSGPRYPDVKTPTTRDIFKKVCSITAGNLIYWSIQPIEPVHKNALKVDASSFSDYDLFLMRRALP